MMWNKQKVLTYLDKAQKWADTNSGCCKVAVGSVLIPRTPNTIEVYGANKAFPVSCRENGCKRKELYGEDSKKHRLPSDCRSLHSEIDAITLAGRFGISTYGATIIITRYPCEACARAIVNAGIKTVFYGRQQKISEETEEIFKSGKVQVYWLKEWRYEDVKE